MKPGDWFEKKLRQARNTVEYQTEVLVQKFLAEIVERMKEHKLTAKELATKMGISKGRISTILNGKHNMRIDTMVAIANALDMELKLELVPKEKLHSPYFVLEKQFSSVPQWFSTILLSGEIFSRRLQNMHLIGDEYETALAA